MAYYPPGNEPSNPWTARPGLPDVLTQPGSFSEILPRRILAFSFDLLLMALLAFFFWVPWVIACILTIFMIGAGLMVGLGGALVFVVLLLGLAAIGHVAWFLWGLIPFAYPLLFLMGNRHATPGMRLMGLEVRSVLTGTNPEFLQALAWPILFYLSMGFTAGFALLVPLFNLQRRMAHDWLCGLAIVNQPETLIIKPLS